MSVGRTYVPWYRRGFAAALRGVPPNGKSRARLPASFRLGGVAGQTDLPIELAGPGDVVGLDPHEIRRCEPYDGCPDFEPGYFPYVEFAGPDLPWRFSPLGPEEVEVADPERPFTSQMSSRLTPWLALVVVPADKGSLAPAAPGGLPVLSTMGEELPPPGESWAWAHVQVTFDPVTNGDTDLAEALTDPSRCVTRILCPRRLAGATRYGAYLVPAYAAGKAVLDPKEVGADPLGPAWAAQGQVRLPVYLSWSFSTSEEGTFELLARRLRPHPAPADASGRTIDTSEPGWVATAQPGRTTVMQGALRPVASSEAVPDPVLAASLRAAVSSKGTDIELLPPIYGQDYRGGITSLDGSDGWLDQLNTDPRRRLAAGLASWAVTVLQEDLADDAWQQLAAAGLPKPAITAANELAEAISSTVQAAHLALTDAAPTALRLARPGGPLRGSGVPLRPDQLGLSSPQTVSASPLASSMTQTKPGTFAPRFAQPAFELLRAVAPEWLLPGGESIPVDSVVVVRAHGAFVEAFLVGLNHALAQELLWRRYPLARDKTIFPQFWSASGESPANQTSIADWLSGSKLGSHLGGDDDLVLIIRGSFVARFPTAVIYLSRTLPDGSELRKLPSLSGRLSQNSTFIGFPLTEAQADAASADGGGPWRIVLQEAVDHARFGVDDPTDVPTNLASWQDLNWSHAELVGKSHVRVAGPLMGLSRPVGAGSNDTATWGLSAGHLASALQQPAFAIRIPLSLWLKPETES
jgi:hypothetical protein